VAAGDGHALALLRDGTVMAWGGNGDGALGAGEVITSKEVSGPETCEGFLDGRYYFPCSMTPLAVSGLSDVTAVAAGDGFSLALLKNGTVEAWGRNEAGVLGNLTTRMSTVPTAISGLREVTQIAAGSDYALALLKNGTVMGWGDNGDGQLGAGNIPGPKACETCSPTPVAVSGLSEVVQVAAGGENSLALLKDGAVMAWGANGVGQLGNGTTTASDVPVAVSGISEATAVAVGTRVHGGSPGRGLAVLKDGTVMAWGFNEEGELGDGTETNSDVPVAVCAAGEQAPCAQDLSGVTAITAGSGHTLALLSNGTVVAWGTNDRGLLGDGYLNVTPDGAIGWNVPVPVPVDGLSDATAISAGGDFSLAIGALAALPNVMKLGPESGPAGGGATVTIRGSNFAGVTAVRFGSRTAGFTVDSETEITAVSPCGTGMTFVTIPGGDVTRPGTVYVTAQSPAGTSPASTGGDLFAYDLPETEACTSTGGGQSGAPSASGDDPSSSVFASTPFSTVGKTIAPKALTRPQKLTRALKQCEKRPKRRRAACRKQSYKRYATTASKTRRTRHA
jgi:alpha-tubulin suppressor-like RCC1 family protein